MSNSAIKHPRDTLHRPPCPVGAVARLLLHAAPWWPHVTVANPVFPAGPTPARQQLAARCADPVSCAASHVLAGQLLAARAAGHVPAGQLLAARCADPVSCAASPVLAGQLLAARCADPVSCAASHVLAKQLLAACAAGPVPTRQMLAARSADPVSVAAGLAPAADRPSAI